MSTGRDMPDYLSDIQKIILVTLNANEAESIDSKLKIQKIMFLISNNIEELTEQFNFENYLIGPYSEIVDEELEQLKIEGFVRRGYRHILTSYGRRLAEYYEQRLPENYRRMIFDMKQLLNDLSEDEILGIIYSTFPDTIVESVYYDDIYKKRFDIAINLFNKNKITFNKASNIAGISQEELIDYFIENKIPIFSE